MTPPAKPPPMLPLRLRRGLRLLYDAALSWSEHRAATMGAAIAFYTLFSMGPVLVIAIMIAGSIYGEATARAGLLVEVRTLLGAEAAEAVGAVIRSARFEPQAPWQTLLTVAASLFAATTVFTELKSSLDLIWDTPAPPDEGILALLRSRLLSFGIVLGVGFVLLVSLVFSAVIAAVQHRYGDWLSDSVWLLSAAGNMVTLVVVTLLFAAIFKLLPERGVDWRDVWRSALLTAGLFMLGKGLIAAYLGTTALASSYGAAGTLVLVLLWTYYSAQVFLYGAALSREMARARERDEAGDA